MGKKYRSDPLAAAHENALGLTEAGVMDKRFALKSVARTADHCRRGLICVVAAR